MNLRTRSIPVTLAALLLIGVIGCTVHPVTGRPIPNDAPPPARPVPTPGTAATNAALVREVIAEGNRARRNAGAGDLVARDEMNRVAQDYADELAGRHEINHTSPTRGRETLGARMTAGGYAWRRIGENLAELSPRMGVAATTIQMWLDSPGHRRNLLDEGFKSTGAGVARDERGTYYIVQVYATP